MRIELELAVSDYKLCDYTTMRTTGGLRDSEVRTPEYDLSVIFHHEEDAYICGGCREFYSIDEAIRYWSEVSLRPEFVLALMALKEAIGEKEVEVVEGGVQRRVAFWPYSLACLL